MLVQFVRDVVIVVAVLAALVALALRPSQESDAAPRLKPTLDTRVAIPPAVVNSDSIAIQPSVAATPAAQ